MMCVERDSNAVLLPEIVPGYKDSYVKLLPSSTTKHATWELYLQAVANQHDEGSGILHLHPALEAARVSMCVQVHDEDVHTRWVVLP